MAQETGATILVVEDDPRVRLVTGMMLESLGHLVLSAKDGRQVIELFEDSERRIDLLLADVILPRGHTGLQLAMDILDRDPEIKVLMVSGYGREELLASDALDLAARFLAKPYLVADLARLIAQELGCTIAA
jgi:DNA-binding NtrC family response regulator